MEKISVKGKDVHPVFKYLADQQGDGEVSTNFTKFLVSHTGTVLGRYRGKVPPLGFESDIS